MSHDLNKSELLIKPFPQLSKILELGLSFGRLFDFEINENGLYQKKETSEQISKCGKNDERPKV